jgi:pimeloyl-ACP methyl ester carboxylesterase
MNSSQGDPAAQYFSAHDGVLLAYRELGAGRPLILIHGYFSTATVATAMPQRSPRAVIE